MRLPNVTVELIDVDSPELARLAMIDTLAQIEPGEALIFSPTVIHVPGARWIEIPAFANLDEYVRFLWHDMPNYVSTSHILFTQWDAWVIDGTCWTDEFLKYDYGGAPWMYFDDAFKVGNGAGLRSLALMNRLRTAPEEYPVSRIEDAVISRIYRRNLELDGFKWMPVRLASRLAFENSRPAKNSRHFMFHDAFNFPAVLDGDRLAERLALMRKNPRGLRKLGEIEQGREAVIDRRLW